MFGAHKEKPTNSLIKPSFHILGLYLSVNVAWKSYAVCALCAMLFMLLCYWWRVDDGCKNVVSWAQFTALVSVWSKACALFLNYFRGRVLSGSVDVTLPSSPRDDSVSQISDRLTEGREDHQSQWLFSRVVFYWAQFTDLGLSLSNIITPLYLILKSWIFIYLDFSYIFSVLF